MNVLSDDFRLTLKNFKILIKILFCRMSAQFSSDFGQGAGKVCFAIFKNIQIFKLF